jgi:hypothetical protein
MCSSARQTGGKGNEVCLACDADRQQPPEKLKFRWGWDAGKVWTLLEFRRLIHSLTHLFPQHRQQTPPAPNLPTNCNEVFDMATLMVPLVFAIVPIIDGSVIGTCDRMHCYAQERGSPTSCSMCDSRASSRMPPMCMQRGHLHYSRVHSLLKSCSKVSTRL